MQFILKNTIKQLVGIVVSVLAGLNLGTGASVSLNYPVTTHPHSGHLSSSYVCMYKVTCSYTECPKSMEPMGILFIFYYLHYMLYMFTPTLCAFSQPLYRVCADFAQHIGIDSSTTVCNSRHKVTKISDFNSTYHP
jgi:hypothetical protein